MKLFELKKEKLPTVKTYTPEQIAKKHKMPLKKINDQLKKGVKVELEHTTDPDKAREIALDHLNELPDYYTKLAKVDPEHG